MPYKFNPFTGNLDMVQDLSGYLPLAGGTLSGALTLANLTNALDSGNYPVYTKSGVVNGATAVGGIFDTTNALSTNGALLFSFKNAGTEKFTIGKEGNITTNVVSASPTTSIYCGNMTANLSGVLGSAEWWGVKGSTIVGALTQNSNANSTVGGVTFIAQYSPGAGNNYSLAKMRGINTSTGFTGTFGGTASITDSRGINITGTYLSGVLGSYYGIYHNCALTLMTTTLYEGIHFDAAPTTPTTKRGIVLKGDGVGNDLVLGAGYDALIYYDGTDLIINPKSVGTGAMKMAGNISMNANDIISDATTGTKIGTATTQKLGIWNAAPIVQPTAAIAAAAFVANTSAIVDDSATWDGYTVGQVVKALRNVGMLA